MDKAGQVYTAHNDETFGCEPLPQLELRVKKLDPRSVLPVRKTSGSAAFDLSCLSGDIIKAGTRCWVSTGLAVALPEDHYGRITGRSGLAGKGIDCSLGLIDSDYRGPIKVLLINNSTEDYVMLDGERIAQLIVVKYAIPKVVEVDELVTTERGESGFGHTGKV